MRTNITLLPVFALALGLALGLGFLVTACGHTGSGDPIIDLSDSDPEIRGRAIVDAGSSGPEAIPRIGVLLRSDDLEVRRAAHSALGAVVQRAARPGAWAERGGAARALLALLDGEVDLPRSEARFVLRLMALVANDGEVLGGVASRLDDRDLADAALFALERCSHAVAELELWRRLGTPHPMRAAIARSLGAKRSRAAVPELLRLAAASRGARLVDVGTLVAARAARSALAAIGDPRAEDLLGASARRGQPGAERALMRYLQVVGENHALSAERRAHHYKALLASADSAVRMGAVTGLGASNPSSSFEILVGALEDASPRVREVAWSCLGGATDKATVQRMTEALPKASPLIQMGLLRALCRCAPQVGKGLALRAAEDPTSPILVTALDLLASYDDETLEQVFLAATTSSSTEARNAASLGLLRHARRRTTVDETTEALTLLHRLLQVSDNNGQIRGALGLLGDIASPTSVKPIARFASTPEHRERVAGVRIAIARELETTQGTLARSLATAGLTASRSRSTRQEACDLLERLGADTSRLAEASGFLSDWRILGPLKECNEEDLSHHPFASGKPVLGSELEFEGRAMTWQARSAGHADGVVDLTFLDPNEHASVFALATPIWPRDEDVLLKIGSDDGVAVWVNGTLVHQNHAWRGVTLDSDTCRAHLESGPNEILVKINQGGGGWAFCVRIADTNGDPLDLTSPDHGRDSRKK